MNAIKSHRAALIAGSLLPVLAVLPVDRACAEQAHKAPSLQASAHRDGQHDFDFTFGNWKTQVKRLQQPLTGSTHWVEYNGTSVVRKLWNGRGNMVELDVRGPAGRIEGVSLRLYDPQSRQWSLNYASSTSGTMGVPTVGEFTDGHGVFHDQERVNGRVVLVRNEISQLPPQSVRFEQSFSDDGGKTWEVNWIAIDTRADKAAAASADPDGATQADAL